MVTPYIARGDTPALKIPIVSPLPDVPVDKWLNFIQALSVQGFHEETSNGLGRFAMRPRRLGDLHIMTNLRRAPDATGRQVWDGDFVPPLTREQFLANREKQRDTLVRSVLLHASEELGRDLKVLPKGVSRSGALAILHAGGPGALKTWNEKPRFDHAANLFARANGIF